MDNNLTDEEIEHLCKKYGCYYPPVYKIRSEIANTPIYLRIVFEELGHRNIEQKIKDMLDKKMPQKKPNLCSDGQECMFHYQADGEKFGRWVLGQEVLKIINNKK